MDLPRSNASMSAQNARCESCWVLEPHTRCIPGIPGVFTACTRLTCLRRQARPPVGHHTVASTLCLGQGRGLFTVVALSDIVT